MKKFDEFVNENTSEIYDENHIENAPFEIRQILKALRNKGYRFTYECNHPYLVMISNYHVLLEGLKEYGITASNFKGGGSYEDGFNHKSGEYMLRQPTSLLDSSDKLVESYLNFQLAFNIYPRSNKISFTNYSHDVTSITYNEEYLDGAVMEIKNVFILLALKRFREIIVINPPETPAFYEYDLHDDVYKILEQIIDHRESQENLKIVKNKYPWVLNNSAPMISAYVYYFAKNGKTPFDILVGNSGFIFNFLSRKKRNDSDQYFTTCGTDLLFDSYIKKVKFVDYLQLRNASDNKVIQVIVKKNNFDHIADCLHHTGGIEFSSCLKFVLDKENIKNLPAILRERRGTITSTKFNL